MITRCLLAVATALILASAGLSLVTGYAVFALTDTLFAGVLVMIWAFTEKDLRELRRARARNRPGRAS